MERAVLDRVRRFFEENGDTDVLRFYSVAAGFAFVVLPLLGALKGDFPGAAVGTLVLEVALGLLYVLLCASNRQFANHPATKLAAVHAENTQLLGGSVDSEGYTAASRG